ncbi:MAG: hypothetical protein ACREQW_23585 [Candidatus Binatia bacterium]
MKNSNAGLDIFWLRDKSLEGYDTLPNADMLAQEIVSDFEAALEQSAKSPLI